MNTQPRPSSQELALLLQLISVKSAALAQMVGKPGVMLEDIRARQAEIAQLQRQADRY